MLGKKAPASGPRASLRRAIDEKRAAEKELASKEAALRRASDMLSTADAKVERARLAVEAAIEDRAARLYDAIAGQTDATVDDGVLRAARKAEQDALDEREAAQLVEKRCEASLEIYRSHLSPVTMADAAIAPAVRAVIAAEVDVDRILSEAVAAFDRAASLRTTLAMLHRFGLLAPDRLITVGRELRCGVVPWFLEVSCADGSRFDSCWPLHERTPDVVRSGEASWYAALDALKTDADAKLPS